MSEEIRIYVADLAAYNAGHLHGVWIDATLGLDDIWEHIKNMLAASPVEEAAIHDYEGFGNYRLNEYESIDRVRQIACFIEEFPQIAAALINHFSGDLDEARQAAEESYCGCYKSLADYAQELTEDTTDIPQHLQHYIDYERMGRDMELSGDIFTIQIAFYEVNVFLNH